MKITFSMPLLLAFCGLWLCGCALDRKLPGSAPPAAVKPAQPRSTPAPPRAAAETKPVKFTFCKKQSKSFYQAYLTREWDSSAFKYLSIDGLRYSRGIIINHVNAPNNDSIFFMGKNGDLGIELHEHFDLEIAFYPPTESNHEDFKPFRVIVIDRDSEIVESGNVSGRMKKYRLNR
ncbi:MAG: hypothetical protein JXR89_11965 [Deltaproteobacteria bacterium]|nr:hypothetical protein [Deltaproteobacteria bacterium]